MTKKKLPPGITPRGNRWRIDTFYKGFRIRESCATPEMAETNLRKIQTLIDEGRYLEKKREPKETLGEFATKYLKWCEDTKEKACSKKKSRLNFVIDQLGKETKLSKIKRADIEKFQAERLTTPGPKKKCVSKATVNRDVSAVRHMFSKAVEWGLLEINPLRGIKKFKETGRRLRYLTPEECVLLLSKCSPLLNRIVKLALHTGMRKSEKLHLLWENVNLREKYIELVDQKNGERSTIPLNQTAIDTLQSVPRRLGSKYVFPGKDPSKPFFDPKRQFENAVASSKIEGLTFHILRHTCASHLVMAGVDLVTVKEILRNKSIDMTMRYAHLSRGHKKSAIDALEMALIPKAEKAQKGA